MGVWKWRHPLRAAYRLLGRRYPRAMLLAQFQLSYLVVLGGVGLLRVYQPMSPGQLWTIAASISTGPWRLSQWNT